MLCTICCGTPHESPAIRISVGASVGKDRDSESHDSAISTELHRQAGTWPLRRGSVIGEG